jgi:uncharacterized cupin superfamily protein
MFATSNVQDLDLGESVPKPTAVSGNPQESSTDIWVSADGLMHFGIWECTPGTFYATRDNFDEVCYILSGTARITDSSGESGAVVISAGDTFVTPKGWSGQWDVIETMRKVYVIRNC